MSKTNPTKADQAAKDAAEKEAADKAAREAAEKEAADKAAREAAEKEAADKTARAFRRPLVAAQEIRHLGVTYAPGDELPDTVDADEAAFLLSRRAATSAD